MLQGNPTSWPLWASRSLLCYVAGHLSSIFKLPPSSNDSVLGSHAALCLPQDCLSDPGSPVYHTRKVHLVTAGNILESQELGCENLRHRHYPAILVSNFRPLEQTDLSFIISAAGTRELAASGSRSFLRYSQTGSQGSLIQRMGRDGEKSALAVMKPCLSPRESLCRAV